MSLASSWGAGSGRPRGSTIAMSKNANGTLQRGGGEVRGQGRHEQNTECLTQSWFPVENPGSWGSLQVLHPGLKHPGECPSDALGFSVLTSKPVITRVLTVGCCEGQVTDSMEKPRTVSSTEKGLLNVPGNRGPRPQCYLGHSYKF